MDIEWNIGDVVTKLRERRRLTQGALAKRASVNKATIVRAEQSDQKIARATWVKIAVALGTTIADVESETARLRNRPTNVTHGDTQRHADQKFSDREIPVNTKDHDGTKAAEPAAHGSRHLLPQEQADREFERYQRERSGRDRSDALRARRTVSVARASEPRARKANPRNR